MHESSRTNSAKPNPPKTMLTESNNAMCFLHFELKNANCKNFLKSQLSDWKDHLIEKVLLLSILTGTITIVICFLSFLTFSVNFVVSGSFIPILCSHAEYI